MKSIVFRKKSLEAYIKECEGKMDLDEIVNVINIHHEKEYGTRYLRQWEAYMGRKATGCANLDCDNHQKCDSLVGAHVKIEGMENTWISLHCATNAIAMTTMIKEPLILISDL